MNSPRNTSIRGTNTKKSFGVSLEDDAGPWDMKLRRLGRLYILEAVEKLQGNGPITRKALAAELGMDRNRVVRLTKALGVEGVFG
jgi:hypothetical protein